MAVDAVEHRRSSTEKSTTPNSGIARKGRLVEKYDHNICATKKAGDIRILLDDIDVDDRASIYLLIEKGISMSVVIEYLKAISFGQNDDVMAKIIGMSKRTIQRRLKNPERSLNSDQSARVVRFALAFTSAIDILGGITEAKRWMLCPALGLDGHKPLELIISPIGAELVNELLIRMDYGVYQ